MSTFLERKKVGKSTQLEVRETRVEGLSPPTTPITESRMAEVDNSMRRSNKPFVKGNKAAVGRKPKLAMLGIDMAYLNITDMKYKSALRRAEYYLKRRTRELGAAFGYVTVGVNALLGTASLQLATSKYLMQLACEAAGVDTPLMLKLMEMSTKLSTGARQNELSAWELCAKEQGAVKKNRELQANWLNATDADEFSGSESTDSVDGDSNVVDVPGDVE